VLDRAGQLLGLEVSQLATRATCCAPWQHVVATILFVLEETLRKESPAPGDWGLMIGLARASR